MEFSLPKKDFSTQIPGKKSLPNPPAVLISLGVRTFLSCHNQVFNYIPIMPFLGTRLVSLHEPATLNACFRALCALGGLSSFAVSLFFLLLPPSDFPFLSLSSKKVINQNLPPPQAQNNYSPQFKKEFVFSFHECKRK